MADSGPLRIGELSRRSGVSPELLRAWERRYGLLSPARSKGGLRLYSSDDLERVRTMQRLLAEGMAAAEAATLVIGDLPLPDAPLLDPDSAIAELRDALDAFDEPAAQTVLDRLFAAATVDLVLFEVVVPFLHDLGDRWERGDASVAQEHFAASVIRGRMLGLARGWGLGVGPLVLIACLAGEQHDLGALAFGLALRSRGWRISYFGADTPLETIDACGRVARATSYRRGGGHGRPRSAGRSGARGARRQVSRRSRRRRRRYGRAQRRRASTRRRPRRRSRTRHRAHCMSDEQTTPRSQRLKRQRNSRHRHVTFQMDCAGRLAGSALSGQLPDRASDRGSAHLRARRGIEDPKHPLNRREISNPPPADRHPWRATSTESRFRSRRQRSVYLCCRSFKAKP